jgi:hypothetical protein
VGDWEIRASALMESSLGYHPDSTEVLTGCHESGDRTLLGGQFDWGGRLLKSNGGAQRFPQNGRKSFEECKGRREPDCDTHKWSRDESRA